MIIRKMFSTRYITTHWIVSTDMMLTSSVVKKLIVGQNSRLLSLRAVVAANGGQPASDSRLSFTRSIANQVWIEHSFQKYLFQNFLGYY